MKSKTKTKKNQTRRSRPARPAKYPTHYLAIVLAAVLLLEGMTIGTATAADWRSGVALLDVSSGVSETASDMADLFQPVTDVVIGINQFYNLAAVEMADIVDMSAQVQDVAMIYQGINKFYTEAADQMTALLDVSGAAAWPSQVAGISVEN